MQDCGSTFAFSIAATSVETAIAPDSRLAEPAQGRIVGLAPGQPVYKILVVDDVAVNRKLLTHPLSEVGFEVQEATNGVEVIAQWQTWHPDLI